MIRILLNFFVIFCLITISKQYNSEELVTFNTENNDLKSNDNIFSTADLSIDYTLNGETIHLDAYKTTNNDAIIADGNPALFGGLRWVSIGRPRILQINNSSNQQQQNLIQSENEKFLIYFTLLTDRDKQILQQEVRRVKGIEVDTKSFINLKANSIDCSVKFFDDKSEKVMILNGKVEDLISSPFAIEFNYLKNSPERIAFQNRILQSSYLDFKCTITGGSTIKKTNTFTITLQESNDIRLSEKLFGNSSEAYVTRNQLTELANEVNSYFNVVEDYQIPEEQFNTVFVESLITLAGNSAFNPVSFQDGLKMLSKYSLNFENDLKPDIITSELSNIFKVEEFNNKSHIVFDEKYFNELSQQSASSGSASASVSIFGIGGGSASASYAQSQSNYWLDKGSSLDDQIKELNSYSENQIQYEFQGNKIVPKSIKVSKMQSSSFKKTLTFSRIKNVYFEADFLKKFTLSTRTSNLISDQIADLKEQLTYRFPEYSIIMVGSEIINKYFDLTGKGLGLMNDWYLCNGQNGSPDLRGRFIVGKSETNNDYNVIGKIGGFDKVILNVDEMPRHTHADYGHSHVVDLVSSFGGEHNHEYNDIFHSENMKYFSNWVNVPNSIGSSSGDRDNVGFQMPRVTFNSGNHQHSINGRSVADKANLEQVGNGLAHENRPPYFVVQYIIYMPK